MSFWTQTWSRFVAAYKAFREPYLVSGFDAGSEAEYGEFDARRLRYAIYWSFYENTAYRAVHTWAHKYKIDYGLYRYVRNIYNPTYRLGELWKAFVWGGDFDSEAGDGHERPSALPISIPDANPRADELRAAIAQLWQWSNWRARKDLVSLYGTVLGDVGLRVVDDAQRKKVYLEVVHPSIVKSVSLDAYGNVKGYVIEEQRANPQGKGRDVTYTEEVTRDGDDVVWRTYQNGQPYAWNGEVAEWSHSYGFVPFVLIRHNDVGLEWGWSEIHPVRAKVHEVDDLASKLSDQVRKMVDAPWLLTGIAKPRGTVTATSADSETFQESSAAGDKPQPGREEIPIFYGAAGGNATPLVAPLDIEATVAYLRDILSEMERDYPELQQDIWAAGGDTSGRALRIARQRVEIKVRQRRPNYDDALVRAQQMAIAIGGTWGYEGFEGFNLDSYQQGELAHRIDKRPVFAADPMDDLEEETMFWQVAGLANKVGMSLPVFLKRQGWSDKQIAEVVGSDEYQSRQAMMALGLQMATGEGAGANNNNQDGNHGESAARSDLPGRTG